MRVASYGLLLVLLTMTAPAAEAPAAIYAPGPEHLWNRLYRALALRTESGVQFGADNSVPFVEDFDDVDRLLAVLDEFLKSHGDDAHDAVKRALLLHDLWAGFDLAARGDHKLLQRRLARAIEQLAMPDASIASLPDNYEAAVKSGRFNADFDAAHPDQSFLPPDLFDPKGAWVQIGQSGMGVVASAHMQSLAGRSAFLVFIRCPGGREATLSYLEKLNLHRTPWSFAPAEIGTTYPEGQKVRSDALRLDPGTPQFPEGTVVALVRQMLIVNDELDPVITPITQSVQLRAFRRVDSGAGRARGIAFRDLQSVFEFQMRRLDLLNDPSAGLRLVAPGEREYRPTWHGPGVQRLQGPVVLDACAACHSGAGIFSVNTYTDLFRIHDRDPQLLPADRDDYQHLGTIEWKKQRFDWGLLRGLLAK